MSNYQLIKNTEWKEVEINGEMKEIPSDWGLMSIEQTNSIFIDGDRGKNYPSKSDLEKNGFCVFLDAKNINKNKFSLSNLLYISEEKNKKLRKGKLDKDDLIITTRGTLGNIAHYNEKVFNIIPHARINSGMVIFKPSKYFNISFVTKLLKSNFWQKQIFNDGGVVPQLTITNLKETKLVIPSLQEQSAIASILSEQESVIENIEQLIEKYEQCFQYLSDELLSGEIRVKEVDGEVVLYKNQDDNWKEVEINGEMKEIPSDWDVKKVSEVSKCLDNKRKPLSQTERISKKGNIPYWGANSIVDYINNYLIDEEVVLLGEDAAPFYDKTKKVAFISNEKIWPNNHIHVLKPLINTHFLMTVLNSVQYEKIIGSDSRPKLTQNMMNSIEFSSPNNNEQNLISKLLTEKEFLIGQQKSFLFKEKEKFNWLLDNLLCGKYLIKEIL